MRDSAAERAGLQSGDVIVAIDGQRVDDSGGLSRGIGGHQPGDEVVFTIERDGGSRELPIELGARPQGGGGMRAYSGEGAYKIAVVPISFSDTEPGPMRDIEDLDRLFFSVDSYFGEAPGGVGTVHGSLREYYREQSNGTLDVTGRVFPWTRLDETKDDFRRQGLGGGGSRTRVLAAALKIIQERYGEDVFDDFQSISFITAGAQVVRRPSALWPHRASIRVGRKSLPYYLTAEGLQRAATIGVHCHEFGHVLGLPDQYGQAHRTGVGVFCVMSVGWRGGGESGTAKPFHLCAWCKIRLGWLEATPIDPRVGQKLWLDPVQKSKNQCFKVIARPGAREYYLIENRQRVGFDADFPNTGLLIWHVDSGRRSRIGGGIDLVEAHGIDREDASLRDVTRILFPKAGSDRFGPGTTPAPMSRTAGALPIDIRSIREDPRTGRVYFDVVGGVAASRGRDGRDPRDAW